MAAEQPPSEAAYSGVFDLPAEGDGLTGSERLLTIKVHQQLETMERSGGRLRLPEESSLRCLPYVGLPSDAPWWVAKSTFLEYFDQNDFLCRQVKDVTDAFLEDWFHDGPGQNRYFEIPPVSVINGKTQFISGRHRTAVLLRHLEHVPLALAMRDIGEADTEWIQRVALSPIAIDTLIELPVLPVSP